MGVAFFLTSFGSLFGTPVQGALLGTTFPWSRPIVFSAVSNAIDPGTVSLMLIVGPGPVQVMSVAGAVAVGTARQMVARRKGSQVV